MINQVRLGSLSRRFISYKGIEGHCNWNGKVITVLGGNSHLAQYAISGLAKQGYTFNVPYRCDFADVAKVLPSVDYGKINLLSVENILSDEVFEYIRNSDIVINFIGSEAYERTAINANIKVPSMIAKMVQMSPRVESFIHYSTILQDINSDNIIRKTRAMGEKAVREVFPDTIIARSSFVIGCYGGFIQSNSLENRILRYLQNLFSKGVIKRPIFSGDLSSGIGKILDNSNIYRGRTFEFYLPIEYYLYDILCFIHHQYPGKYNLVSFENNRISDLIASFLSPEIAMYRTTSRCVYESEYPSKDKSVLTFEDVGIVPQTLEESLQAVFWPKRRDIGSPLDYVLLDNSNHFCPSVQDRL